MNVDSPYGHRFWGRALLLSCLLISIAGTSGSANAVDQLVRRSDNVALRGAFGAMTVESVTIKLSNGKEETVSVADIGMLRFDQEPPLLAQAQSNERSGALDSALTKYQQIQSELSGADKRLVTEVQFLIARVQARMALADPAKLSEAMKTLQDFRTANSSSCRYLEATLLEAGLAGQSEQTRASAQTLLQEVKGSSVRGFQLQAGVELGRLLLKNGDAVTAAQTFEEVVQQSAGDSASQGAHFDALLGKALCLQQQSQVQQAISALDEVLEKVSDSNTRILAEAWNYKGECLSQLNQPKAAMMAHLHVDILYSSEPAQHAHALFRLSRLWNDAGHPERAADAAARLSERYPNSSWVKQLKGG